MSIAKDNQYKSAREKLSFYNIDGECHEYIGATNDSGYCVLMVNKRFWYAHRLAYFLEYGDIPDGMTVDHLCFNRKCINVNHLRLLSNIENSQRHKIKVIKDRCVNGHKKELSRTGKMICRPCTRESSRKYKMKMRG